MVFGVAVALAGVLYGLSLVGQFGVAPTAEPDGASQGRAATVLARGLEIPWSLIFLPGGDILITERPGRIRLYDAAAGLHDEPLLVVSDVAHTGEGGLLGIAVHPAFPAQPYVYVYHTYQAAQGLANRVVRYTFTDGALVGGQVIIDAIPGANIHNGGRLRFGPDGFLYISTGDAAVPDLSQQVDSLAGKILRLADDGAIPADNPFAGSPIFSLGHRNPQGMAWDDGGRLWVTEHGQSATDEVNLIWPGANYGWPIIRGDDAVPGLESPFLHSGRDTWAPSGIAYVDGRLFFAGLRGASLFELTVSSGVLGRHLQGQFGRLREVAVGPDGYLYILSSNRDGRGIPSADDDRLICVDINLL